jgi:hypothetical protein
MQRPAEQGAPAAARAPPTTMEDRIRLLHIMRDPRNVSTIESAHSSFRDREVTDLPAAERPDYWQKLADRFNDYDSYVYTNVLVIIQDDGEAVRAVQTRDVENLEEYNPTNSDRPKRDGRLQLRPFLCFSGFG